MITIIKDSHSVLIKHDNNLISFPLGSFVIRKSGDREISIISTITSDRFKADIINIIPRITENVKIEVPTEQDSEKSSKGDIWHSKKSGMFYLHDGKIYKATNTEKIIEIYMLRLSNILNHPNYI